jgi:hypothetical protein
MDDYLKLIIATAIGIALKPIGEYLVAMAQFNFIGFRVRKLSGKWKTSWSFKDTDKSQAHGDFVNLRQTGPYIRGEATGEHHHYIIKGRLNPDGCVQGTWRDIQAGTDWYGSFKLKVHPDGKKMIGKWIGNSSVGIRAGDWIWDRCAEIPAT